MNSNEKACGKTGSSVIRKPHDDVVLVNYIKVAANTIGELRKVDVYRVLGSIHPDNIDGVSRSDLATYISEKRPDLADEVSEVMEEEFRAEGWTRQGKQAVGDDARMRLWFAMVDHRREPGTQALLIAQATQPSDMEIFRRVAGEGDASKLSVSGIFDLSHVLSVDPDSMGALQGYLRSVAVAASPRQELGCKTTSSLFDTMVPWSMNRSPIGPAS